MDNSNKYIDLAKLVDSRVKTITMQELRSVFNLATDEEVVLIVSAIQSGNAERIKASIEMPVFRVMQEKVIAEDGENLPFMLRKQAD